MEKKTKIFLLVVGSVLVVGSIALGVYLHFKNKDEDSQDEPDQDANPYAPDVKSAPERESETRAEAQDEIVQQTESNQVVPAFNAENELTNPLSELKGRYLYPKRKSQGGWGYTNIRTSAKVNTDQGWWDPSDNLITTINSGTVIGKVLSETAGTFNGYSYRWFKVKLVKPIGGWFSDYTEGYVRGDTVTFKPY